MLLQSFEAYALGGFRSDTREVNISQHLLTFHRIVSVLVREHRDFSPTEREFKRIRAPGICPGVTLSNSLPQSIVFKGQPSLQASKFSPLGRFPQAGVVSIALFPENNVL